MREKLQQTTALARENLEKLQRLQKQWYDRAARLRTFEPGEEVLLLHPMRENKLLVKWQGPYKVQRREGPVTY